MKNIFLVQIPTVIYHLIEIDIDISKNLLFDHLKWLGL